MIEVPRGFQLYVGRGATVAGPRFATAQARRARDARVRTVLLCAEGKDGWTPEASRISDVADCWRQEGVGVGVYSLHGREATRDGERAAERLLGTAMACRANIVQLDAEEAWRGRGEELARCMSVLVDGITERHSLSVSTYGTPSTLEAFPWDAILGYGWLGWQVYETAANAPKVRSRLAEMRAIWGASCVVPAIASYERVGAPRAERRDGAERLRADALRVALNDGGVCDVPGLAIWSDASLDGTERDVMVELADRFGW